jgi:hypothetical protein
MKPLLAGFFVLGLALAAKDSCLECHSNLDGRLQAPAKSFPTDIHSHHGFRCNDCHGGDPNVDDRSSHERIPRVCRKVRRSAIPAAPGAIATQLIHKFRPQQRVDQRAVSDECSRQAAGRGDEAVATCTIATACTISGKPKIRNLLPIRRLPQTCALSCDAEHMAKYKIGTTQFAEF